MKEQSYAVIVENKIHDAIFQRNQLARYINVAKSLTNENNVFIVLLPYESSDGYIEDIPDSVWRLPCDWKVSNKEKNVHYEEILHSVLAILRICLRISKKNLNARIV